MQKNVLMYVFGERNWMGGIYYVKNLLFQLSISCEARKKYRYFILANNSVISEFLELIDSMNIIVIERDGALEQLLSVCTEYNIDVVLPIYGEAYTWIIKELCLYWIPDFQEIYFPENFSAKDIEDRKVLRQYIAQEHAGLILSSEDVYSDYKKLYPQNVNNTFVVHFVSAIGDMVRQITPGFEKNVMEKYEIRDDYIFIANQFWKHKNYIVVLKAMNEIINQKGIKLHLVCTGFMNGREDDYIDGLYQYVEEHGLKYYIHFCGLVDRKEQLCLMKNAKLLIQPSKFEGWGCSVEDAKVMGKEMVLSDIAVHKEQQYPKAILFPPNDSKALAMIIIENINKAQKFNFEYGSQYTVKKAHIYAQELQKAIDSIEVKEKKNYLLELERLRDERIEQLFKGIPLEQICIYGVGKCTEQMIESCIHVFGNVSFVYSDSDEKKWGMDFKNGKVFPPSELLNLGIKRIIISSINYQEEIYNIIKKFEKNIEIVKIYNSPKERNEPLWL